MGAAVLTIRDIRARAVDVPLERPIRTAVGTILSAPLVLVDVVTNEGVVGRSYLFTYLAAVQAPLVRLLEGLGHETSGKPVVPIERMRDFDRRFRLLGWQGLVGMAVSGLDMAFWDAIGKSVGLPVAGLLGGGPRPLPAYDSYGIVDPIEDEKMIVRSVGAGFRAIKIKIGGGDLARDVATVKAIRQMIGPEVALMVDYNQSLNPVEAERRIDRLAEYDLHWVEEPVAAEDIHGHAKVRAVSKVPVQTGENWWFPRDMAKAITAGASDYAMLDIMKIGGVTGWLGAAGQADAVSLPVSSHIFIEASAHMLAATPTAHWLEYLDVASPILVDPCQPQAGMLTAKGPGLGLDWNEKAVERFKM